MCWGIWGWERGHIGENLFFSLRRSLNFKGPDILKALGHREFVVHSTWARTLLPASPDTHIPMKGTGVWQNIHTESDNWMATRFLIYCIYSGVEKHTGAGWDLRSPTEGTTAD